MMLVQPVACRAKSYAVLTIPEFLRRDVHSKAMRNIHLINCPSRTLRDGPEMETDPKTGKEFMVKSLQSDLKSPVQFTNKTDDYVQIIWIDYSGFFQNYKTISPRAWIHANTYVSHPWIFRHPATKERYTINGLPVFHPPPPKRLLARVNFEIHKPLRTLRVASLMKVSSLLQKMEDAYQLSLPKQLAAEVEHIVDRRLHFLEQRRNLY